MIKLDLLIKESKFKLEALPQSYFVNYFEDSFIPQLEKINRQLCQIYKKCNKQSEGLAKEIRDLLNELS